MKSLDEYAVAAEKAHGHMCAGQVLGLRMATYRMRLYPDISDKNQQQMRAYREMADEDLFSIEWVKVTLGPEEFPGYKGERRICEECGEGINFKREVIREGRTLCKACAGERYYTRL